MALVVTLCFAFTTSSNSTNDTSKKVNKEEDLYCSVKVGDNEASCWFCSCTELVKSLKVYK